MTKQPVDAWCANCKAHIRECCCFSPYFVTKKQLDAGEKPRVGICLSILAVLLNK